MKLTERVRDTVWSRHGVAGELGYLVLRPLSELFGVAVQVRNVGYRLGLLRVHQGPIPVISVGNLVVGGTGKTPLTLWLGRALMARGLRVAILSRGYGGTASGVTVVSRGGGPEVSPALVGDEAVMMAKSFAGPVVTAARRIDGAAAAVQLGCDMVVLDDGFQHRAIARAFDLVLLDGHQGALLPAGRWRERIGALRRADAVMVVDHDGAGTLDKLSDLGADLPVYRMQLKPVELVDTVGGQWHSRPLGDLVGRRVVAVVGVARPAGFYGLLRRWEAVIGEVFEFPDHHCYTQIDWQQIARRSRDAELVVTTEKDLVKLEAFPFATGKLVALRITPQVDREEELIDSILAKAGRPGAEPFAHP